MIKIKVSYESEEELQKLVSLIQNEASKIKLSNNDKGRYKKAYIELKKLVKQS